MIPAKDATVATIYAFVVTAGATLTAGQNFAGIYDGSGTRLAVTADQAAAWGSTGEKAMALTGSISVTRGSTYYVALLVNHGGTSPAFFMGTTGITSINAGTTAPFRWSYEPVGGRSTLPASITLASNALYNSALWAALG